LSNGIISYYAKYKKGIEMETSTPEIGGAILFQYPKTFHIAVIMDIKDNGFLVREANYKKCKVSDRLVVFNDPYIFKFVR